MKTWKILGFFWISIFTLATASVAAFVPNIGTSGIDACYYSVSGSRANGTAYDSGWKAVTCSYTFDFAALPDGIGNLPDGTYTLKLKWFDRNILGDNKTFSDGTLSNTTNKMGIFSYGPYKIDTRAPKCTLKEIRFKAGQSNNQYYHSGSFYYKQSSDASGRFELLIEADDTEFGSNTSGVREVQFPTVLGVSPSTESFATWTGKTIVTVSYNWSGSHSDTFDILNNPSKQVCFDNVGNSSVLSSDVNTKVVFEDGNHTLTNIPSLILTPDSTVPTVNGVALNNLSNGFKYTSWNDGLGPDLSVYDGTTANIKYFAAFDSRKLIIPKFQDNGSGLKSFKISVEQADNSGSLTPYFVTGSTKDTKLTTLTNTGITHDFSEVRLAVDNTDGYRPYAWGIQTLNLAWANEINGSDAICDMVGNCMNTPTPDFRVVANIPLPAGNTSLSDTATKGTKHNLDATYAGSSSMRSNLSDTHTTLVYFRDRYGNEILPVLGVKTVGLTIKFDNSMGCDQLYASGAGNCVDFTFKNNTSELIGTTHGPEEVRNFWFSFTNPSWFSGNLSIELESAIPTKDEYITESGDKIYGNALNPTLQLKNLQIHTISSLAYSGAGERPVFEVANSGTNQPSYKWNPLVNFTDIDDIYPLVEGQEKGLKIKNFVSDKPGLPGYNLNTRFGTNNAFLQFRDIYLTDGNDGTKKIESYAVFSGASSWDGWMDYTDMDTLKFTPKTIGGISSTNTNIALFSNLAYSFPGKSVILPSLQTGFAGYGLHEPSDFASASSYYTGSTVVLAEVDIRGISQTRNIQGGTGVTTDNKFIDVSRITLFDFKADINKNVAKLLSGIDKNTGKVIGGYTLTNLTNFPNSATSGKNLQNGQVLYFKDTDVTLNCGTTCEASGKKTIIIENGNLFVKSDMKYANANSALGIILIGNKADGDKSQLRIAEGVTNGVGIVYSEWPVISVKADNTEIYNGAAPSNTSIVNQLYWRGSFATRNTVGWSIKDGNGVCPYGTPDYKKTSCTVQKAQGYDLIYLRRYARIDKSYYPTIVGNPMGDGKVPVNIDRTNVKIAGGDTYKESDGTFISGSSTLPKPTKNNLNAPFIIEYDSQTQTNPPLWFTK